MVRAADASQKATKMGEMSLDPAGQYAADANLRARQRLWEEQQPPFDMVAWVLDLAGLHAPGNDPVLDVGCGNGAYLTRMRGRGIAVVGCDTSAGMLAAAAPHRSLVNADVTALPFPATTFGSCSRRTCSTRSRTAPPR